jgi:CHAD domain-containing protein
MPHARSRTEIVRSRVSDLSKASPRAIAGRTRAIHQVRVASRRLCELLPALPIASDLRAYLAKDLRRVRRALGPLRELDVLIELAGALTTSHPEYTRDLTAVIAQLEKARRRASGKAARDGIERRQRRVIKRLRKLSDDLDDKAGARGERWRRVLGARVAKRAGAVIKAIGKAGSDDDPKRLHAVRLTLKKLRYAVELAKAASGVTPTPDFRRLRRAQDLLGELHDRQLLMARLRRSDALGVVISQIERDCRRLHVRYIRSRGSLLVACQRLLTRAKPPRARGAASTSSSKRTPRGR